MDDKSAQAFGCFLGVLLAVMFSLPVYIFFDFPMWAEYTISGVLLLVFGTIGNVIVGAVSKRAGAKAKTPLPPQKPQPKSTEQPKQQA